MSQSLILIIPEDLEFERIGDALPVHWKDLLYGCGDKKELHFQETGAAWYITISKMKNASEIAADYIEWEDLDPQLKSNICQKNFWIMSFNNFAPARDLLICILEVFVSNLDDWWIDTDYGWVISGKEMLRKSQSDGNWDWRRRDGNS